VKLVNERPDLLAAGDDIGVCRFDLQGRARAPVLDLTNVVLPVDELLKLRVVANNPGRLLASGWDYSLRP